MFVNKINGLSHIGFKGYEHVVNSVGETIQRFYYPYDDKTETCEILIYKVIPTDKYNFQIREEKPIATIPLEPNGVDVNLQEITNLDKNETFAYKVVRKNKQTGNLIWEGADTGSNVKKQGNEFVFRVSDNKKYIDVMDPNDSNNKLYSYPTTKFADDAKDYGYSIVSRKGTTPLNGGFAYLAIPDSLEPGWQYYGYDSDKTGELYYDEKIQKEAENSTRTNANVFGGTFAAMEALAPDMKRHGITKLYSTPITSGDDVSSHGYWAKNNMQIALNKGNTENFKSLLKTLYKNNISFVFDGTFSSEGIEGIHFNYAQRWADKNPQMYYWFKMSGIRSGNLNLSIVPENFENLQYKLINPPVVYELENGRYVAKPNSKYDNNKETRIQFFDRTQVTKAQAEDIENIIEHYDNSIDNKLDHIRYNETIVPYTITIENWDEYKRGIDVINDFNKNYGKDIKLDSAEAAMIVANFSKVKLATQNKEGGYTTWDANVDIAKMNYQVSGYDEKLLQAIPDKAQRDHELNKLRRGAIEVTDWKYQTGKYWTQVVKDAQVMYTAKTIGLMKSADEMNKLIDKGLLPPTTRLSQEAVDNILNGQYLLSEKGMYEKDLTIVKNLMELPLDTLTFGDDTVGVLSTSYFSNRATTEDQIGKSRFDLMLEKNPHLADEYAKVYERVNELFTNELKDFTESVMKEVDSKSNEKLFDKFGDITEFGEYVLEYTAKDIAQYALLKSLAGEFFDAKIMANENNKDEITYNYRKIKDNTTLKALGINASSPEEEALMLEKKMRKGLQKLTEDDVKFVAKSISGRISNLDTMSFRFAEAKVNKAGKGADWRLDASKDLVDQDAVKNREDSFDDNWEKVIKVWAKFVQAVKEVNPHSSIVAEMTDVADTIRYTYGNHSKPYEGQTDIGRNKFNGEIDAMTKFFNETGITSEAAYSYFFTHIIKTFTREFEKGEEFSENHDALKERFDLLLQTRNIDTLRNLMTFVGNHDKTRIIHGIALDMNLFHSYLVSEGTDFGYERDNRRKVIQTLSGVSDDKNVPIELRLNVDNFDYYRTVSPMAVAQARVLMTSVQEDLKGIVSDEDIKLITDAIVDMANGNYLRDKQTTQMTKINIDEISTLEKSIRTVVGLAEQKHGLTLSDSERDKLVQNIVNNANNLNIDNYLVQGDFSWGEPNAWVGEKNRAYLAEIKGNDSDWGKYSLYTVQLARLIKDASKDEKTANLIQEALKDFIYTYDKVKLQNNSTEFTMFENPIDSMHKNKFGTLDFRKAMKLVIEQAEFKSGKQIQNKQEVIDTVFNSLTEPAAQKAAMMMAYLQGVCGTNTLFSGDEYCMSGYEEKSRNPYNQNRNVFPRTEINDPTSKAGANMRKYEEMMFEASNGKSNPDLKPLNNGTPYGDLDVIVNGKSRDEVVARVAEIQYLKKQLPPGSEELIRLDNEQKELSKALAKFAYLYQGAEGETVITVFNAEGINHDNRHDYFKDLEIHNEKDRKEVFEREEIESVNPNNRYVPVQKKSELDAIMLGSSIALPVGTLFVNADLRDKFQYEVRRFGEKLGIVRTDGGKIVMSGKTAKYGVMTLRRLKNVVFRGGSKHSLYSKQFNIVSNPYKQNKTDINGNKLSIIAK